MLLSQPASVRLSAFGLGLLLLAVPGAAQIQPTPVPAPAEVLQAFTLNSGTVQDLVLPLTSSQAFQVTVVLGNATRTLNVYPKDLRTPGYKLLVDDGTRLVEMPRSPSTTFQGSVAGNPDSVVAVSLVDGQLSGIVDLDGTTWGIQPVSRHFPAVNRSAHVVYRHVDTIVPPGLTCGTADDQGGMTKLVEGGPQAASALKEAEIAIDCDNLFYTSNTFGGGSVPQSESVASNIISGVSSIYSRDVGVQLKITTIIVRTTAVYSGEIGTRLQQFQTRWNQNHSNIQRDLAHLLSGKTTVAGGGTIGVSYLGVVCNKSQGYGASQVGWSRSLTAWRGLVAHESGHQFSAGHCSGSTCYIMCAVFNQCGRNVTKFGPSSITRITNYVAGRPCLSTVTQNAPTLTAIVPNSVESFQPQGIQIQGTDLDGASSVQVGSATITSFSTTATTLNFALPSPFDIGSHSVTVTNSVGTSNAVTLDVTGNHPSVLVTPSVHFANNTEDYVAHTDKNWLTLYFFSPSGVASTIPGLVNFGIGSGFTAGPYQLAAVGADSTGTATLSVNMPSGLAGTLLYWQCVTYDPFNLTVPLEVSNVHVVANF